MRRGKAATVGNTGPRGTEAFFGGYVKGGPGR